MGEENKMNKMKYSGTSTKRILRLCLRVWRGGEGMVLKKRKKQVEGMEKFGREGTWRVIFSS
jgi:hypothetical protein